MFTLGLREKASEISITMLTVYQTVVVYLIS